MQVKKCKMQSSGCITILNGASLPFKEPGSLCSLHFKFYTFNFIDVRFCLIAYQLAAYNSCMLYGFNHLGTLIR